MNIGSKEFPGKIIKWTVIIGVIIVSTITFHESIVDALETSIEGVDLSLDYIDRFWIWWDG